LAVRRIHCRNMFEDQMGCNVPNGRCPTARPFHLGGRSHVWHIEIRDENERLVCVSRLTMAVVTRDGACSLIVPAGRTSVLNISRPISS